MRTVTKNSRKSSRIGEDLAIVLRRKAPANEITWMILGGKQL
ncbi:hypothetical protein [Dyadobacter frigoris]|nr:hypothetical protein [Dyadobacter frigoris]